MLGHCSATSAGCLTYGEGAKTSGDAKEIRATEQMPVGLVGICYRGQGLRLTTPSGPFCLLTRELCS